MKITNRITQTIYLEGFGIIEIAEGTDGRWHLDLFPRGAENDEEKLILEVRMKSHGDKYFTTLDEVRKALTPLEGC